MAKEPLNDTKVLIADNLPGVCDDILKRAGIKVEKRPGLSPDELKKKIKDYEGVIVRSEAKLTGDVLSSAVKLRAICRAGVGIDNVDVTSATKKGIVVMNTPEGNSNSTAEHTIGFIFALARKLSQAHQSLKSGQWERKKFVGVQISGKTLGIIGMGRIGREVAKRAAALGLKVVAYDPYILPEIAEQYPVHKANKLEDLLKQSDFVTVHVPLNNSTRNMITKREFDVMKKGVSLINCARGGIVSEKDLYDALVSGKVSGAALDVFEEEPPKGNKLLELEQVIATPHLGAQTSEAQEAVAVEAAEQMVDALSGRGFRNTINLPVSSLEEFNQLRPFMDFTERMGSFLMQLMDCGVRSVTHIYAGDIAKKNTRLVTDSFLVGLLKPCMDEGANLVSAPILAMEKGMEVSVTTSSTCGNFTNLITARVKTDKTESFVTGAIFDRGDARVVSIDGYNVEAILEGTMLVVMAQDRPGLIGSIGTLLGDRNINIARMTFGRRDIAGKTISILIINVDGPVSTDLTKDIEGLKSVDSAKLVHLS
ncbi:MAG TPA: phosphoglycerate dehydrogenase [Candidatus Avalokitesvara rifleensis]|uniref:phosphoglycerate dehydrogenase n=1 Tax=Candidatus Avalokitesvara rifleensis TaxID=3367620 RepID=UPI0040275BDC